MARRERQFEARSPAEREWVLDHTWCPHCEEADLGMTDPAEYEDGGRVYVEGRCRRCGGRVVTAIAEAAEPSYVLNNLSKNSEGGYV